MLQRLRFHDEVSYGQSRILLRAVANVTLTNPRGARIQQETPNGTEVQSRKRTGQQPRRSLRVLREDSESQNLQNAYHCYSTPDIEIAYAELISDGVQPEDENGKPLTLADLQSPSGKRIIWLPKRFGHFSIEILEDKALEVFVDEAFG